MIKDIQPGDTIAYSAKFLRDTCQHTGPAAQRRGVLLGQDRGLPNFVRVRWEDTEQRIAEKSGNFAEEDYCAHVREFGSLVHENCICRVGSPRFACNDL